MNRKEQIEKEMDKIISACKERQEEEVRSFEVVEMWGTTEEYKRYIALLEELDELSHNSDSKV